MLFIAQHRLRRHSLTQSSTSRPPRRHHRCSIPFFPLDCSPPSSVSRRVDFSLGLWQRRQTPSLEPASWQASPRLSLASWFDAALAEAAMGCALALAWLAHPGALALLALEARPPASCRRQSPPIGCSEVLYGLATPACLLPGSPLFHFTLIRRLERDARCCCCYIFFFALSPLIHLHHHPRQFAAAKTDGDELPSKDSPRQPALTAPHAHCTRHLSKTLLGYRRPSPSPLIAATMLEAL